MTFWKRKPKLSDSAALLQRTLTAEGDLREFVYLDDVSVRSLRASRVGPLPAELKDMQSAVLAAEVSGTATAAIHTVAKASIQSTLTSTRSGGAEILRKTIVQSDFKDLRDGELDRLLLGPAHQPVDLEYDPTTRAQRNSWAMPASEFKRSELLELSVRLGAAGIFKIGAVFDSLTTLLSGTNSQLDPATAKILRDMGPMNEMVQELLAGLVPIECIAVDYVAGQINGEDWVVHASLVDKMPDLQDVRPLIVAATTSSALYWQDLRQVLFADLEFDMLARITRPGVSRGWSPVKLADVLRDFSPATAQAVDDLDALIRRLMREHAKNETSAIPTVTLIPLVEQRLIAYAHATAASAHKELSESALVGVRSIAAKFQAANSISDLHPAYDEVSTLLSTKYDITIDVSDRAQLRADANALPPPQIPQPAGLGAPEDAPRAILEAEVIAIYW